MHAWEHPPHAIPRRRGGGGGAHSWEDPVNEDSDNEYQDAEGELSDVDEELPISPENEVVEYLTN